MTALKGKTIIATSDMKKADRLSILLEKYGAHTVKFPLIKITAANDLPEDSEKIIQKLKNTDWVVFSSSNGVSYFFKWLRSLKHREIEQQWKYAVIGNATTETLAQQGLKADFISSGKNASEFAQELSSVLGTNQKQILFSAGNRSSETIPHILGAHHHCQKLVTYQTQTINYSEADIKEITHNQRNNIILFMSPSAVNGLFNSCNDALNQSHLKTAVIGTTTRKALAAHGFTPDFMPSEPNLDILVKELAQYFENKQPKYKH